MVSTTNVKVTTDHVEGTLQYEPFKKWLLPLGGSAALLRKKGREVEAGDISGLIVQRDRIVPYFLEHMEHPCTDTMNLALDIFDRHGRLQEEYLHHPIRRGLGVWQHELSDGNFLVIETATVMKKFRRQGIGRRLVTDMIQTATRLDKDVSFVFAYPTCLHEGEDLQSRAGKTRKERFDMAYAQSAVAVKFFRQLGFRRIGISPWFALSVETTHRSRTISIAEDVDPPEAGPSLEDDYDSDDSQPEVPKNRSTIVGPSLGADGNFDYSEVKPSDHRALTEPFEEKANRRQARSKYAQLYPIHYALQSLPDAQCLALLKERSLNNDGSEVDLTEVSDCFKNNILHAAACHFKPECVAWILNSIAVKHPNLKNGRNIEGYTALEALQSRLDVTRLGSHFGRHFIVKADKFDGFVDEAVLCMISLNEYPAKDDTDYWNRKRFGCTCGLCRGGFLSHRMRQSLLMCAEEIHNRLEETEALGSRIWSVVNESLLDYIPKNIRSNFRKSKVLRRGVREFITTVIECLQTGECPTTDHLMSLYKKKKIWPQMHTFYFGRGGSIEPAMNVILDLAVTQFEEDFEPGQQSYEPLPTLPRCRNDYEFEMVRRQCVTVVCDDQGPEASTNERLSLQAPWIPFLMQMMENNGHFTG